MREFDPVDLRVGTFLNDKPFVNALTAAWPRLRLDEAVVAFLEAVLGILLTLLLHFDRRSHLLLPVGRDLALTDASFRLPKGVANFLILFRILTPSDLLHHKFDASTATFAASMRADNQRCLRVLLLLGPLYHLFQYLADAYLLSYDQHILTQRTLIIAKGLVGVLVFTRAIFHKC